MRQEEGRKKEEEEKRKRKGKDEKTRRAKTSKQVTKGQERHDLMLLYSIEYFSTVSDETCEKFIGRWSPSAPSTASTVTQQNV